MKEYHAAAAAVAAAVAEYDHGSVEGSCTESEAIHMASDYAAAAGQSLNVAAAVAVAGGDTGSAAVADCQKSSDVPGWAVHTASLARAWGQDPSSAPVDV